MPLTYAVITPARDEAEHLGRLATSLAAQTTTPSSWVIVDDGSVDATPELCREVAAKLPFAVPVLLPRAKAPADRGAPVVRAFTRGLEELPAPADVVVKLDADVSFSAGYFGRLLAAFDADPQLGIAGGSCYERDAAGVWRQRFGTRNGVWGACRAYRMDCLQQVLPLEERQGWDDIDALKAEAQGWNTGTVASLPFRHHRTEGARDASRVRVWLAQGEVSYYMGYRPSYAALRAVFRGTREPAALAIAAGYLVSALRRRPRCPDRAAVEHLREQQRLRCLALRAREALGRIRTA